MNETDMHPIDMSIVEVIITEAERMHTMVKLRFASFMKVTGTNQVGMIMNHMTVMTDRIVKEPEEDSTMISVNNVHMKPTHHISLIKIGITVIEQDDEYELVITSSIC